MFSFNGIKRIVKSNKVLYYPIKKWHERESNKKIRKFHEVGYILNNEINEILKKADINYIIAFGNLLGIVRDRSFIQYDNDLDYIVFINQNLEWNKLIYNMKQQGYKVLHMFVNKDVISEIAFVKYGIQIDMFGYMNKDNCSFVYGYYRTNDRSYDHDEVSTSQLIIPSINEIEESSINNSIFKIPHNYEEILERSYGVDWRIPIKGVHHSPYLSKDDDLISYKLQVR